MAACLHTRPQAKQPRAGQVDRFRLRSSSYGGQVVAEPVIGRVFRATEWRKSDKSDQEQIQMIAAAIGTPKPSAPKVARTNSESRFAWGRASGNGMALLPGAPASLWLVPRMNDEFRLLATLYNARC